MATVLVVEDDPDMRELERRALSCAGHDVLVAEDGHEALRTLQTHRPSVIVLDVMMPGMDGWQVCRTIKGHPQFSSTRVVMVTAKGGFEDKFEGMRSGADDYVVKPVNLQELAEKVERNLAAGGKRS